MVDLLFLGLSFLAIGGALAMIVYKDPMYSALGVLISMLSVAGIFALLNATFLFMVQIIVYAGAIRMANYLDMLVEAAVELRKKKSRVFIAVIGDGRDRYRLEGKVVDLGLENIKFCGPLPKSAMPGAIATADACFAGLKDIPMFTMTYPNKVFDYMAAARPPVLAIDGVIREVVEAAGGGVFVPPSDAAVIADVMHELSNKPERAKEMGNRAFLYVNEKFNRDNHAEEFARVLDHLARKPLSKEKIQSRKFMKSSTCRKVA